jgi:hypothetical protein
MYLVPFPSEWSTRTNDAYGPEQDGEADGVGKNACSPACFTCVRDVQRAFSPSALTLRHPSRGTATRKPHSKLGGEKKKGQQQQRKVFCGMKISGEKKKKNLVEEPHTAHTKVSMNTKEEEEEYGAIT